MLLLKRCFVFQNLAAHSLLETDDEAAQEFAPLLTAKRGEICGADLFKVAAGDRPRFERSTDLVSANIRCGMA